MQQLCAVTDFEHAVADFFGAPCAVATDSCTHALELSVRAIQHRTPLTLPRHTAPSVPMMLDKLSITYRLDTIKWRDNYDLVANRVVDAATSWEAGSYRPGTLTCISFASGHLSLGRGGMILLDDEPLSQTLRLMVNDGCDSQGQVQIQGFHYFMTPLEAQQGLAMFMHERWRAPRIKDWTCYQDLGLMPYFRRRCS